MELAVDYAKQAESLIDVDLVFVARKEEEIAERLNLIEKRLLGIMFERQENFPSVAFKNGSHQNVFFREVLHAFVYFSPETEAFYLMEIGNREDDFYDVSNLVRFAHRPEGRKKALLNHNFIRAVALRAA